LYCSRDSITSAATSSRFQSFTWPTIEALARAIDAKDGTAENHIRRVQVYATAVTRVSSG
jgi:HD-GYP domain-containing protein (c-di-GMP phosphodiesterase class II)